MTVLGWSRGPHVAGLTLISAGRGAMAAAPPGPGHARLRARGGGSGADPRFTGTASARCSPARSLARLVSSASRAPAPPLARCRRHGCPAGTTQAVASSGCSRPARSTPRRRQSAGRLRWLPPCPSRGRVAASPLALVGRRRHAAVAAYFASGANPTDDVVSTLSLVGDPTRPFRSPGGVRGPHPLPASRRGCKARRRNGLPQLVQNLVPRRDGGLHLGPHRLQNFPERVAPQAPQVTRHQCKGLATLVVSDEHLGETEAHAKSRASEEPTLAAAAASPLRRPWPCPRRRPSSPCRRRTLAPRPADGAQVAASR